MDNVLTKNELEKIYRENSNDDAAKIIGVSVPTMLKYLKDNGIKLKGAGANNQKKVKIIG